MADEKTGGKVETGKTAPKVAVPAVPKAWEPTGEVVTSLVTEKLQSAFSGSVTGVKSPCGEAALLVKKEKIIEALTFLKNDPDCAMNYLSDLTAAHYPNNEKPFEVVYHCFSLSKGRFVRVKTQLGDQEPCPTATVVWRTADWMEREVHDMFGIVFEGHPNLKTILLPEGWEGHPLRKEYPLGGPKEEEIRANKFSKPRYLPDDLKEATRIIKEARDAE